MTFEQAKQEYVHRFTMEHVPDWAHIAAPDGKYYAPQFATDQEWYDHTIFPPDNPYSKTDCQTTGHTWPLGQWLDAPYIPEGAHGSYTGHRNYANGMTVLGKYKKTIFVRLPREIAVPCNGGCICDYCKKNPELTPMWDTLAIGDDGRGHTWTVHMPEVPYHLMTKKSQK